MQDQNRFLWQKIFNGWQYSDDTLSSKYATPLVHIIDGKAADTFPEDLRHYDDVIIRHWQFQGEATSADNSKEFVVCSVDAKIASLMVRS